MKKKNWNFLLSEKHTPSETNKQSGVPRESTFTLFSSICGFV